MRKIILVVGLVLMATGAQARSAHTQSTWDGVYTEDQAARGQTAYRQNCGRCHGADLSGTFEVPPLVGRFATYWSGSTVDTTRSTGAPVRWCATVPSAGWSPPT